MFFAFNHLALSSLLVSLLSQFTSDPLTECSTSLSLNSSTSRSLQFVLTPPCLSEIRRSITALTFSCSPFWLMFTVFVSLLIICSIDRYPHQPFVGTLSSDDLLSFRRTLQMSMPLIMLLSSFFVLHEFIFKSSSFSFFALMCILIFILPIDTSIPGVLFRVFFFFFSSSVFLMSVEMFGLPLFISISMFGLPIIVVPPSHFSAYMEADFLPFSTAFHSFCS